MLRQERGEISIFSEMQQILLVQCIDLVICVFLDNIRVNDIWFALVLPAVECLDTIERETTRKTSNRAKQTFK